MTVDGLTVISLDRTPARFEQFLKLNPGIAVERFSAVDGRALDRGRCIAEGLIRPENQYSPGVLGSASSHVSLWRRCASEGRITHVAEDDAILRRDFAAAAGAALSALVEGDIVLWGWNYDWPLKSA